MPDWTGQALRFKPSDGHASWLQGPAMSESERHMSTTITDAQVEEVERILSYHECHAGNPRADAFTLEDCVKLLRDILPEESAYKADDCTSVGFSGQGRCIESAVLSLTTEDGQRRSCWKHYVAPEFTHYEGARA